jgi:hypothetical protein
MQTKEIIDNWARDNSTLFWFKWYSTSEKKLCRIKSMDYKPRNGKVTAFFTVEVLDLNGYQFNGEEQEPTETAYEWKSVTCRQLELCEIGKTWTAFYNKKSTWAKERNDREEQAQSKRDALNNALADCCVPVRWKFEYNYRGGNYQWNLSETDKEGMEILTRTLRDAKKFYDLIASGVIKLPDMEEQEVA